jgi:molecular chaperone DnaK (HSP70)
VKLGRAAKDKAHVNPENTVYNVKRLLGKKMDDPKVAEIVDKVPYSILPGPGGKPKISVEYMHNTLDVSAVDLTGRILKKMKTNAET